MATKRKLLKREDLDFSGGLITLPVSSCCLGDLLVIPVDITEDSEIRVFDPTHGRVPVTAEEAKKHNEVLSNCLIDGLDNRCKVGQGGLFYFNESTGKVTTWNGTEVAIARKVSESSKTFEFTRNGKTFRGRRYSQSGSIFFKRVK